MKHLHTKLLIVLTIAMVPAMQACKVTINNNTDKPYQLREVPNGKPKTVAAGQKTSFGSAKHMAHFIVAEETNGGWHDIYTVEQTTCGGDKNEKKISMKGILAQQVGKHEDKFKIMKI